MTYELHLNHVLDQVRYRMVYRSRKRERDTQIWVTISAKAHSDRQHDMLVK